MTYKVSYFPFKGLGEPVRFMLAYGNVEWIDNRVEWEDFKALKSTLPLGQFPILEVDGKVLNHNRPICRYLGNKFGLAGSNELENYEIDAAVETVDEFRTKIAMWFYGSKAKDERYERLINEVFSFYLERLEEQAKNNGGFLATNRITWADIYAAAIFDYCNTLMGWNLIEKYPNLKNICEKVEAAEGVKKYLAGRPACRNPLENMKFF